MMSPTLTPLYHALRAERMAEDLGNTAVDMALQIDEATSADQMADIYSDIQAYREFHSACKKFANRYRLGGLVVRRVGP